MNGAEGKNRGGIWLPAGILLLVAAALTTGLTGKPGINEAKATGILLAVAAFAPVFVLLLKSMRSGTPNEVLGTFVGGFFFKLLILGIGIWWGIKKAGFEIIDYSVACLAFLVAFQILESLYFARRVDKR